MAVLPVPDGERDEAHRDAVRLLRDRGVRDYSTLTEGRVGVLDRIDSLCFAAPVFFHLTRVYFTDSV